MASKCGVFCAFIIIVLIAGSSAPCRLGLSHQAAFASAQENAPGAFARTPTKDNEGFSAGGTTSEKLEVTQLLQYVGGTTQWFSLLLSVILAVFAFLITAVQIVLGIHLSRKEEQATKAIREHMENSVHELRLNQKTMVNEAIEEYAKQFDRTILNEIQRITRTHVNVHNIVESVKIQLMNGRLSGLSDGRGAEGSVYSEIFMQSMKDTFHLMEVVSGKSNDVFNGLGYIKEQLSKLRNEGRPSAIPELLRALDARNELQDRNNYMLARQICEVFYGTTLDGGGGVT